LGGDPETPEASRSFKPGLVAFSLDQVQAESIRWLWQDRIPLGKLTLLVGHPDAGKSYLTIALAAALSRGDQLPGNAEPTEPVGSLIFEMEDGLADTVKPRAELCGAVPEKIRVAQTVRKDDGAEVPFSLQDTSHLKALLEQNPDIRMVVINPIAAVMSPGVNDFRENEVRAELAKLDAIAREYDVAIIGVKHFNKRTADQGGQGLNRISGSVAFGGAVRSVLGIESDGDRRLLVPMKSNLSKRPHAVSFRITDRGLVIESEDPDYRSDQQQDRESRVDSCGSWLRATLQSGSMPSKKLQALAEEAGYPKTTLDRARTRLGVRAVMGNLDGKSTWFATLERGDTSEDPLRTLAEPLGGDAPNEIAA
jgi:hypothetical protein